METTVDLSWLPAHLAGAGYTAEALKRGLGVTYPDDVGLLNHAPALHRLAADRTAAGDLTRLFFLEADAACRRITALFPPPQYAALVKAGVLHARGDTVRARLRVDPVGDRYFAADRRFRPRDRHVLRLAGDDPVYPPSSDSLLLRDAIVAPTGGRILDLCTGSGVQAIERARDAERVVAVDINPRAVALARFNARLNGIGTVEVRAGDLYAPVRGEQFDLVIANPPFVSSPYHTGPSYHAGGPTGDRVLRRIIGGLRQHLRPGGRAFAISHVALRARDRLEAVAQRWFRNFPGRALVLLLETGGPIDLAAAQSLFALARGLSAYAGEVQRWVTYLHRQRIITVALVLVVAERGERSGVEVIEAQPRVLSLPVSPPPVQRIRGWLEE